MCTLPILDQAADGRNLCTQSNYRGIPSVPPDSEAQSVVNVTGAELRNRTRQGKLSCHFSQRHHHSENCCADNGVA